MSKVILTRDGKDSCYSNDVYFWPANSNPQKDEDGTYCGGKPFSLADMSITDFRRLFGFTPRKGSKGTYELTPKKIKG